MSNWLILTDYINCLVDNETKRKIEGQNSYCECKNSIEDENLLITWFYKLPHMVFYNFSRQSIHGTMSHPQKNFGRNQILVFNIECAV